MPFSSIPESVVILEPKNVCGEFRSPIITALLLFLSTILKKPLIYHFSWEVIIYYQVYWGSSYST